MILPAITTGVSFIQSAVSLLHGDTKDPQRFAKNAQAYQAALQGDQNAAMFLDYRSGAHDPQTAMIPGYGEVGGWATGTAKADARAKFQQLSVAQTAGGLGSQIGNAIQPIIQPAANKATRDTTRNVLIIAAVAVGVVLYFRHRE